MVGHFETVVLKVGNLMEEVWKKGQEAKGIFFSLKKDSAQAISNVYY